MQSQFRGKCIGVPKLILGIHITHLPESKSMLLTQRTYINKVVKDFGGGTQHITALTPMQGGVNLQKAKDTEI